MRKFLVSLLAAGLLFTGVMRANAVLVSYTVSADGGATWSNTGASSSIVDGGSTLDIVYIAGVVNLDESFDQIDITSYLLSTTTLGTSGGDNITYSDSLIIRFAVGDVTDPFDPLFGDAGFSLAPDIAEFTQTIDFQLSNIRKGNIQVSGNVLGDPVVVDGNLGDIPVTLRKFSLDVPGAPGSVFDPPGGPFTSTGAATDEVRGVPEPGVVALLVGAGVPVTLFTLRRRNRK